MDIWGEVSTYFWLWKAITTRSSIKVALLIIVRVTFDRRIKYFVVADTPEDWCVGWWFLDIFENETVPARLAPRIGVCVHIFPGVLCDSDFTRTSHVQCVLYRRHVVTADGIFQSSGLLHQ